MIGYKDIYKADCLAYIPPVYSDILEFKALAKCFNLELERTGARLEEVENNFFIDSLNELDYSKNHLTCKLNLGVKARMDSVKDLIEKTVPLNISTEVVLLYNTHKMLASKTHKELGKYTHTELREGSIV